MRCWGTECFTILSCTRLSRKSSLSSGRYRRHITSPARPLYPQQSRSLASVLPTSCGPAWRICAFRMSLPAHLLYALVLYATPVALGQSTSAVCRKTFDWMTNSLGQSPCLVTSWLFVPCYGPGNGSFIESLTPDEVYEGPQAKDAFDSTPCDCNTVLYSVFAACGLCQGANIDPWPTYSTNCTQVSIGSYPEPIPGGTAIPAWAFLDVTTNSTFNIVAAMALAAQDPPDVRSNLTTSAGASSTSTSSTTSTSSSKSMLSGASSSITTSTSSQSVVTNSASTSTASATGSASEFPDHRHSDIGAIVGGTVGGIIGVLLTGVLMYYVAFRKPKDTHTFTSGSDSSAVLHIGGPLNNQYVISPTSMQSVNGALLYDANDPRTYPPPIMGSVSTPTSSNSSGSNSDHAGKPHDAVPSFYRGLPQV
ncbi:hypothetical protein L226DRAFT_560155 [Lentinus tigrinus ALCF2SS1-7]|uniref:uncharacterized protein n=1 Tax=Lentinus tigrinus ALCF2SS1-7 TaxID=1328758 RepID=UPI0011662B1A|nr:hypothetical protein L226DRAFT_560155 [Lentinus tigrinus ALCF2SS1-7]